MSTHPAYAHMLARLLVGAEWADQLRAGDRAGYGQLVDTVHDLRRTWWANQNTPQTRRTRRPAPNERNRP